MWLPQPGLCVALREQTQMHACPRGTQKGAMRSQCKQGPLALDATQPG